MDYSKLLKNNPKAFSQMEPFLGKYLSTLPINENYRVLDIGCFQGSNLLPFIEFGVKNIYGVDKEEEPLKAFSQKVYNEYGVEVHRTLDLKVIGIENYAFPKPLDLIMCFKVFQHLTKNNSLEIITKIQNSTLKGGYNLFILWEKGKNYHPSLGYFTKDEICSLYESSFLHSWEIIECSEKELEDNSKVIYFAVKRK